MFQPGGLYQRNKDNGNPVIYIQELADGLKDHMFINFLKSHLYVCLDNITMAKNWLRK